MIKDKKILAQGSKTINKDLNGCVESLGIKKWYKDGVLHRDNDLPAIEFANGNKEWYQNGNLHRDNDLPAIERNNGDKEWWFNNNLHRDNDLPAIEFANGNKEWYQNGNLHRDNDLPAREKTNGDKEWYQKGVLHRENGLPAVIENNEKDFWWYNKGKKNRLDGPAVVCVDYELFFINDIELEKETFDALPRNKDNKIHSEKPIILTNKYQEKIVRVFDGVVLEEESFNKKILEEKIKKTIKTKEIKMRNEHIRKNN